jgi:acyl carrier protein
MTDIEIASLWAQILDIDEVEPDDDFFEIGGNSLLALDVVSSIAARCGVAVPLGEFFASPTPHALAQTMAQLAAVSR